VFIASSFFELLLLNSTSPLALACTPKTDFKHKKGKNHERVAFSRLTNSKSPGELMLHALSKRIAYAGRLTSLASENVRSRLGAHSHALLASLSG
jgi:hypothetical protein